MASHALKQLLADGKPHGVAELAHAVASAVPLEGLVRRYLYDLEIKRSHKPVLAKPLPTAEQMRLRGARYYVWRICDHWRRCCKPSRVEITGVRGQRIYRATPEFIAQLRGLA